MGEWKVQVTSQGSTNPVITSTSFAAPAAGSHYAYYTVNYGQGSANLLASNVAPHGLTVLKTTSSTNFSVSEITANLVTTRGGNGTPITAVYAFRISGTGVSTEDEGTYQFAIAGGAVTDALARGSVGTYGTTYSLYFSHSARPRPVVVSTATDPDPI